MIKRGSIKSTKVYVKEDGRLKTKYAVQVKLRGKDYWSQAKKGEEVLIFATQQEADQIVLDYVEELKKSVNEKLVEGKVKLNTGRKKK
jgi:hypothetical protein